MVCELDSGTLKDPSTVTRRMTKKQNRRNSYAEFYLEVSLFVVPLFQSKLKRKDTLDFRLRIFLQNSVVLCVLFYCGSRH